MQAQLFVLLTILSTINAIPTPQIATSTSPNNPWTAGQPQQARPPTPPLAQPPMQQSPPKTGPPAPSFSLGPNGVSVSGPLGTYHSGPDGTVAQGMAGTYEQTKGQKGTTTTISNGLGEISVGPNGINAAMNGFGGRGS